jgi:HlyD family secretion protein
MRNMHKTLLFACLIISVISCKKNKKDELPENVNSGRRIVETGELAAIDTRSFIMPMFGSYWYQMKIIGVLKHGSIVKAGDSIIQLDPSQIKKYIIERESDLATQMAVLEKLRVNQENKQQELASKLKTENASFNLKKLELESSRFESDRIRRIKELEFQQAKIELAKAKRLAFLSKKIDLNEMKIEQIKTKRLKDDIKFTTGLLPRLTIRTPISGIFQVGMNQRTGELIKIGDEIYYGNNLGNVPDLKWMKATTSVSENDFMKIRIGQDVIVRLDAMPKVSFKAQVSSIGKLCHLKDEKSRQKVFDVDVKILKPDSRLKLGMTVSCEFKQ